MPLAPALQGPLETVFEEHLAATRSVARRLPSGNVSEVDWIERFHERCASTLEGAVRSALQRTGASTSVTVDSALIHGSPFQVLPDWKHEGGLEIGDLLIVGQQHDRAGALQERQALLLQMKVGWARVKLPPRRTDSTSRQAYFYATWPRFCWRFRPMRAGVLQPPCRQTGGGPSDAAQFGEIGGLRDRARRLHPTGSFTRSTALARELARVVRLDLGVDATPAPASTPDYGWPQIVQDILERAPGEMFHGARRSTTPDPEGRRAFAVVAVATGPQGILD